MRILKVGNIIHASDSQDDNFMSFERNHVSVNIHASEFVVHG
jgi:hypothetical protein